MKIDILSDTHFDSWFGYPHTQSPTFFPSKDTVIGFWRTFKPKGDYLVLAGDIGHSIEQNIHILKHLKEAFYQEIILVLGNHDYYLIGHEYITTYTKGGLQKAEAAKEAYRNNGFIVLDGTTVTLEEITFGGAMGWYNSAYVQRNLHSLKAMQTLAYYYGDTEAFLQDLWGDAINDKKHMKIDYFDALYKEEYAKLESIHQHCDVMISHYNPSIEMKYQISGWEKNPTTSFFCFDAEELIQTMRANLWIYGHNHTSYDYTRNNKRFITNALGYKGEAKEMKIVTIEV
ncbi:metallophosphoesterase [Sulfurospirillum halorespirans]|uniref:Putative metallophosphoesterase n=1 Tax=Sulfurospirillum halorespirans DSM 13726 TaxID=1193502 RepID=A0A1D7TGR9_9BACT|nr:metallophosphoesterase [Sulfurospirillum halorespirans]AOO64130.1 putative metallophosphoesterase [Sulfurospirillum halorespirans DSM 13726]